MAVVFALLAALSNAASVSTQHIASTADARRSSGWRVVSYLFRNPLWLFGWAALAGAFLFQALALHDGLVSVVQPLLVTELVFVLVLRRFWIYQSIRWITWVAAAFQSSESAVIRRRACSQLVPALHAALGLDRVPQLPQPVHVAAQRARRDPQLPGQLTAGPVPAGLQQRQEPQRAGAGISHVCIIAEFRSESGRYRP